jgi:hypothetical protein
MLWCEMELVSSAVAFARGPCTVLRITFGGSQVSCRSDDVHWLERRDMPMYLVRFLLLYTNSLQPLAFCTLLNCCLHTFKRNDVPSGNTLSFTLNTDCHQNTCLSLFAGLNSKQVPFLSFNSKFCVSS